MKKNLKTILLGVYAGLSIALGGLLNITANFLIKEAWIAKLVGSLCFPVGLTLVCFLAMNLFTGKIGYVFDKDKSYLLDLLLMYIGNIIGSLIAGFICLAIFKNIPEFYAVITRIVSNKANIPDFAAGMKVLIGSVLCGALVYTAVFCYKTFKNVVLKVVGIFVPIALFVYLGFDHCVANMFYFTFGFSFGNPLSYLNIAIATVGNSIGAIALNEGIKAIKSLVSKNKNA